MKLFNSVLAGLMLTVLMMSVASATQERNTLVLERISTSPNGTSSGQNLATHAMMQRLGSAQNCTDAVAALNNVEVTLTVGGKNIATKTLASCIAVDYSVQY